MDDVLTLVALTLLMIVLGAAIYIAATLLLWQLSGQPAGAESVLIARVRAHSGRRAAIAPWKR
jgi:hypothetical protein